MGYSLFTGLFIWMLIQPATVWPGGLSEPPAAPSESPRPTEPEAAKPEFGELYQLRVRDRWLAQRTLKDLVALLEGQSRTRVIKGRTPEALQMNVSLPPETLAYFIAKLSGLGELVREGPDQTEEPASSEDPQHRITIEILSP